MKGFFVAKRKKTAGPKEEGAGKRKREARNKDLEYCRPVRFSSRGGGKEVLGKGKEGGKLKSTHTSPRKKRKAEFIAGEGHFHHATMHVGERRGKQERRKNSRL